jgi:Zn ribbon nucleic-acid-binding protein
MIPPICPDDQHDFLERWKDYESGIIYVCCSKCGFTKEESHDEKAA